MSNRLLYWLDVAMLVLAFTSAAGELAFVPNPRAWLILLDCLTIGFLSGLIAYNAKT